MSEWRQRRANIEQVVADRVIDHLRSEGRHVGNVRRPDHLTRNQRAPNFDFELESELVALEVTEFNPDEKYQHARSISQKLDEAITERWRATIETAGVGYVFLSYVVVDERAPNRSGLNKQLPGLLDRAGAALAQVVPRRGADVKFDWDVDWLIGGHVLSIPDNKPKLQVVGGPMARFVSGALSSFLDRAVRTKSDQTAGYDRAILAVLNGWVGDSNDYRVVLAGATLPWWRLYVTEGAGVALVYAEGAASAVVELG